MGRKIFAGLVTLAFLYVTSPLLFPIAMGGVLAVLFTPWLERLKKKKISAPLGSAILTAGITLLILLPSSILAFFVVKTAFQQIQAWKGSSGTAAYSFIENLLEMPKVHNLMLSITEYFPISMLELAGAIQELAAGVGSRLAEFLGGAFTHLPALVMALSIVVVSVYFFLVDGPKLIHFVRRNSIFSVDQTNQLLSTLEEMCRSVVLASVISGGFQAFIEVIACVLAGVHNVALIGSLVFIGSFIPVVGALPITLAVALQQFFDGHQIVGGVLLIVALIVAGIDNMVRPLFLKGAANLHPLLAFVAAFGGLQTLGFLGVFLGPIVAALFVVTVQIVTHPDGASVPEDVI